MKKTPSALLLILCLALALSACSASRESLPVYCEYKPIRSDSGVVDDEGNSRYSYTPVSEENYSGFVTYLENLGWSAGSQTEDAESVSRTFVKGELNFTVSYTAATETLSMIYPEGAKHAKSW